MPTTARARMVLFNDPSGRQLTAPGTLHVTTCPGSDPMIVGGVWVNIEGNRPPRVTVGYPPGVIADALIVVLTTGRVPGIMAAMWAPKSSDVTWSIEIVNDRDADFVDTKDDLVLTHSGLSDDDVLGFNPWTAEHPIQVDPGLICDLLRIDRVFVACMTDRSAT